MILERQVEVEIKAMTRNIVKCDILLDFPLARPHSTTRFPDGAELRRTTLRQTLINKGFGETANEEHLFKVEQCSSTHFQEKKIISSMRQICLLHVDCFSTIIGYVAMLNDSFVIAAISHRVLTQVTPLCK